MRKLYRTSRNRPKFQILLPLSLVIKQFTWYYILILHDCWRCKVRLSLSLSLNISFGSIRLDTIDELVRANTTICGISWIIHENHLSWGLHCRNVKTSSLIMACWSSCLCNPNIDPSLPQTAYSDSILCILDQTFMVNLWKTIVSELQYSMPCRTDSCQGPFLPLQRIVTI